MRSISFKARYVFPIAAPPVPEGVVTIAGDRIIAVGRHAPPDGLIDLGNVALVPGLVNAHTHLEFSDLKTPIGSAGMAFTEWIAAVVARRRQAETRPEDALCNREAAVRSGLEESRRTGVAVLGEIATPGWPRAPFGQGGVRSVVFLELLGLTESRIGPLRQLAADHLRTDTGEPWSWRPGLCPHAPYTVHPELLHSAIKLGAATGAPVAMHLAETREELELLRSGTGAMVELLRELGAWDPGAIRRATRPLDYLEQLARARRALVVHGNYLARDEIEFLAARRDRISVVYCPRTHQYFGHDRYPLAEMLSAGVHLAIGTDSRASNPDLSVLEELRYLYRQGTGLSGAEILRLGTLNGARALGWPDEFGILVPGACAHVAIAPLPDWDAKDPHEMLLGSNGPISKLLIGS